MFKAFEMVLGTYKSISVCVYFYYYFECAEDGNVSMSVWGGGGEL